MVKRRREKVEIWVKEKEVGWLKKGNVNENDWKWNEQQKKIDVLKKGENKNEEYL